MSIMNASFLVKNTDNFFKLYIKCYSNMYIDKYIYKNIYNGYNGIYKMDI